MRTEHYLYSRIFTWYGRRMFLSGGSSNCSCRGRVPHGRCSVQFSPMEQAGSRIVFSIFAVVSLMLLVAVGSRAQEIARPVPPQERRAIDPLSGDEQAQAERIARSDGRVKELLGEAGVRVVSVLPVLIKTDAPEKLEVTQREVEVVLFRPQG